MVSILFKPGPRPQTRRKPFITPCREGNVGKNQSDHVAPSLAAETWTASSLPLQSPHPGYAHWLTQTASTPRYPSSFSCHSLGLFLGEEVGVETKPRVQVTSPSKDRLQLNFREIQKKTKTPTPAQSTSARTCLEIRVCQKSRSKFRPTDLHHQKS